MEWGFLSHIEKLYKRVLIAAITNQLEIKDLHIYSKTEILILALESSYDADAVPPQETTINNNTCVHDEHLTWGIYCSTSDLCRTVIAVVTQNPLNIQLSV